MDRDKYSFLGKLSLNPGLEPQHRIIPKFSRAPVTVITTKLIIILKVYPIYCRH